MADKTMKTLTFDDLTYEIVDNSARARITQLEENQIEIDTTLSKSGYAADAQATGSKFNNYVPRTRSINGKMLTQNITLNASDINALPNTTVVPSVDDTLQVDGAAADALIVGNKFTSLEGSINTLQQNLNGITVESIGAAPKSHSHAYMEFTEGLTPEESQFFQGAHNITKAIKDALNANIVFNYGTSLPETANDGEVFFLCVETTASAEE